MKNFIIIFLDSIFYFFSLGSNPIEKQVKMRRERSDTDSMAQDWYNVGNDIKTAYEKND